MENEITLFFDQLNDDFDFDLNIDKVIIKSYRADDKCIFDEEKYYKKIKCIIKKLSSMNKKIILQIDVIDRELFKKIIDLKKIPSNINFIIRATLHPEYALSIGIDLQSYLYSIDEFIQEETKLNDLIKNIKNSSLSQFEKYIFVYNIVKKFKPYKENEKNLGDSRCIKNILKNDYMVCAGFSNLLKVLLDKVNIPCIDLNVDIFQPVDDKSNELELLGHKRNLIRIDDDKYNIHGIYVADSTFDHNMDKDLYDNCILTFNQRVKRDGLIKEDDILLLFQFKDEKEFYSKTNIDVLSKLWDLNESRVHLKFIKTILNVLIVLDPQQYKYFYETYYETIDNYTMFELLKRLEVITISKEEMEEKIKRFYKEYCEYILNNTIKIVDSKIVAKAVENIKNQINK